MVSKLSIIIAFILNISPIIASSDCDECNNYEELVSITSFFGMTGASYFYVGEYRLGNIMLGLFIYTMIGLCIAYPVFIFNRFSTNRLVLIPKMIALSSYIVFVILMFWTMFIIIQISTKSGPFDNVC